MVPFVRMRLFYHQTILHARKLVRLMITVRGFVRDETSRQNVSNWIRISCMFINHIKTAIEEYAEGYDDFLGVVVR